MNGGWVFFILLILAIILGCGGYFAYRKFYLKRNDLPTFNYPAPAPSGIVDKVKEAWGRLRNPKSSTGAGYEATGGGYRGAPGSGRRGHALDPDEAWDSRVGNEADVAGPNSGYYEEQELGLHQSTEYHGGGAGGFRQAETLGAPDTDRNRSRSPARSNPFGDDNAASLRSVSPRPHMDTAAGGHGHGEDGSPTQERRSIFRENV